MHDIIKQIEGQENLTLDFDGVIHSYTSGWQGTKVIPDEPVLGAIDFLMEAVRSFKVTIFSSRNFQEGGIAAMQDYLRKELLKKTGCHKCVEDVMRKIEFPFIKPAYSVFIDDRAFRFEGIFPTTIEIKKMIPWNRP